MLNLSGFPGDSLVENPPPNVGDMGQSLGREYPLEEEMATHSSILAWKIPWTEEPLNHGVAELDMHTRA